MSTALARTCTRFCTPSSSYYFSGSVLIIVLTFSLPASVLTHTREFEYNECTHEYADVCSRHFVQ